MRVLVTGANGFLGRHVVAALTEVGHEVVAVVRSAPPERAPWTDSSVEVRIADLRVSDLADVVTGVDVVVHLAAQVTGSDEARFGSTVVGTERLLAALPGSAVSRLVLVSSYSVYDWQRVSGVLDESSPLMTTPYGRDGYTVAKVWQERIVREYAESGSTELVVLRPGFIWGPGKEDLAGAGIRIGSVLTVVGPRTRLPLTHVANCADAVVAAVTAEAAAGATVNVVDGPGVSAWRYSRLMASRDPGLTTRLPVPYALARLFVTVVSSVMPRLFREGGKLPGVLVPASFEARFRPVRHQASAAAARLGWSPRLAFEDAERQAIAAPRE